MNKKIISLAYKIIIIVLFIALYLKVNNLEQIFKQNKKNSTREEKYNILTHVSVSVQIDYLKQYLGVPSIINHNEEKKQKEYIFVDSDYYIQVITDQYDKVLSFVITSRKKDFNPTLKIVGVQVQLGKTTFFNKGVKPNDCFTFVGNTAPSYYLEKYYGWNGTSYQDYLLGYNDAGYGDRGIVEETLPNENGIKNMKNGSFKPKVDGLNCNLPSENVRKKYIINTFGAGNLETLSIGVNRRLMDLVN